MFRYFAFIIVFVFSCAEIAVAVTMLKAEDFKKWLESGKSMIIVDIQPTKEFEQHHFKGSIETNAYPAKTEVELKKLDPVAQKIKASSDDVVIVCPRGGGGAKGTFDYLKSKGIDENRLYILEKGIAGWPYKEMFIKGR